MAENPEYTTLNDCLTYPKFKYFAWNPAYNKYIISMLKILNIHNDVSRLYLLIQLDLSHNNVECTIDKLLCYKINQHPDAVQLTSSLKTVLLKADPIYLDLVGEIYAFDQNGLSEFLQLIKTKQMAYPKIQEYDEKVKIFKIIDSLTVNFKVDEFVRMCPDPEKYFHCIKFNSDTTHFNESLTYLENRFKYVTNSVYLIMTLKSYDYNLTKVVEALETDPVPKHSSKKRIYTIDDDYIDFKNTVNLEFLKEIAYLDHKEEILKFIENERSIYQQKISEAKINGQLRCCECCFNNELLSCEVFSCPAGHSFCSSCIKQGVDVAVGSAKLEIECFAKCDQEIHLSTIKEVIDDKVYQRIIRLKKIRDLKASNIEGLETCAFCDFCVVLSPDVEIIECLNPECLKETCRKCREESHLPFKCHEIISNAERKVRTMIENKMNEVLLRTCSHCNETFVKESGCNRITCICGKKMCYTCKEPLTTNDYSHFNVINQFGTKCSLFTEPNLENDQVVDEAATLVLSELKEKDSVFLANINISKILSDIKMNKKEVSHFPLDFNELFYTLAGRNATLKDNFKNMKLF